MSLTIYSYNIHSGKTILFRSSLSQIIEFFQKNDGDLIALQEVQNNSKFGWHFKNIKTSLHLEGVYGGNLTIADGAYGNATLSSLPILHTKNFPLPSKREPRGIIYTKVNRKGLPIHLYNTHLSLRKRERNVQIDILRRLVNHSLEPTIVCGDFNSVVPPTFSSLRDLAVIAGKTQLSTMSPLRKRIDYIFASNHFKIIEYEVIRIPYSDHYPIRAVVDLH